MKDLFGGVYYNRKVLITGHTGFKGSWLALWLSEMGADVVGYALEPPTVPSHFELLDLPLASVIGDIRNAGHLSETFKRYEPEIVFHMAAQPLVRLSYKEPKETIETNVMGTVNVFEACRKFSLVKAIVNVTSDKCYENKVWVWGYRESDPMGGYDPYSASKGCVELLTNAYRNSFFHPDQFQTAHRILLASVRAGNVIGGGDWAEDRLIPDMMRAVSAKQKTVIRNPMATRPWQHVLEPLSGYLQIGQRLLERKKEFSSAWNFGPGDEGALSVKAVAEYMKRFWDVIDYVIQDTSGNPHEANMLKLDCSKAHIELKWKSIWNNDTAFERTAKWYREYYEHNSVNSLGDLAAYIQDARNKKAEWVPIN